MIFLIYISLIDQWLYVQNRSHKTIAKLQQNKCIVYFHHLIWDITELKVGKKAKIFFYVWRVHHNKFETN